MNILRKVSILLALFVLTGSVWIMSVSANTAEQSNSFTYQGTNYVWYADNFRGSDGQLYYLSTSRSQTTQGIAAPLTTIQAGMTIYQEPSNTMVYNVGNLYHNAAYADSGKYHAATGHIYCVFNQNQFYGLGTGWYPGWENIYSE